MVYDRVKATIWLCIVVLVLSLTSVQYCNAEDSEPTGDTEKTEESHGVVIGIDLGTTYSCVGVYKDGRIEIVANEQGNRITPSYVAFTQEGERLIGDAAKNQLTSNPENTVFDVKRLIGRNWEEPSVKSDVDFLPYKVVNTDSKLKVKVDVQGKSREFTPEEISAMVLNRMKETAQAYLGHNVTAAVVTVPAYFNDAQRQATKDAGAISGLKILRIINEPTAAALAYGLDKKLDKERNVLVFDLGGGTFDVSILTLDEGVFEVLSTSGDTHLGGEDFDQRVIDHLLKIIHRKTGRDLSQDTGAVQKLRREAEKAKRALSYEHSTSIDVENIVNGVHLSEKLTRAKFEELNMDLFKSTLKPIETAMKDGNLKKDDIHEIILVGGSTRIPKVQQMVKDYFNGKEPSRGVNPDEAVAYGAAVQASIFMEGANTGDLVILDVCPLSLGIELQGGIMSVLIKRGTTIPTKKSQVFSTAVDNQKMVDTLVYEGERPMTKDNHLLGKFETHGIPPAPRGIPQIEVTFQIDVNSILKVTAKDLGTGSEGSIVIQNDNSRLSPEDIERMIKDAETFAEQDKQYQLKIDARNDLESFAYSVRTQINDKERLGAKLSNEDRQTIEKAINEQLQWLDENQDADAKSIVEHQKALEDIVQPITTKLYEDSGSKHPNHDDL